VQIFFEAVKTLAVKAILISYYSPVLFLYFL